MAKDPEYVRLIHTNRWLLLRRRALSEHPVCQRCEEDGLLTPATEVHHIVPCEHAQNGREMESLMFDPHNLRCLCHNCHVKIHIEMGRSGKAATKRINEAQVKSVIARFFDDPGG